jgi:hypothetical protein
MSARVSSWSILGSPKVRPSGPPHRCGNSHTDLMNSRNLHVAQAFAHGTGGVFPSTRAQIVGHMQHFAASRWPATLEHFTTGRSSTRGDVRGEARAASRSVSIALDIEAAPTAPQGHPDQAQETRANQHYGDTRSGMIWHRG